jgi:nucleotide-binding universal stress UspA family protein
MTTTTAVSPTGSSIRLRKILYATDFSRPSRAAFPVASGISQKFAAKLIVASICEPIPYSMIPPQGVELLEKHDRELALEKADALLKSQPRTDGIACSRSGNPVEALWEIVQEQEIDLVLLGTHGRTGVKHLALGSVAEELYRCLSCPVITVGPQMPAPSSDDIEISRILFPTDLSQGSLKAFSWVAEFASAYRASVTVFHSVPAKTLKNPETNELSAPLVSRLEREFSPLAPAATPLEFIVEVGEVAEQVLCHAKSGKFDLIAMGVSKAPEIISRFANSVAYQIVLQSPCPVLTIAS